MKWYDIVKVIYRQYMNELDWHPLKQDRAVSNLKTKIWKKWLVMVFNCFVRGFENRNIFMCIVKVLTWWLWSDRRQTFKTPTSTMNFLLFLSKRLSLLFKGLRRHTPSRKQKAVDAERWRDIRKRKWKERNVDLYLEGRVLHATTEPLATLMYPSSLPVQLAKAWNEMVQGQISLPSFKDWRKLAIQ